MNKIGFIRVYMNDEMILIISIYSICTHTHIHTHKSEYAHISIDSIFYWNIAFASFVFSQWLETESTECKCTWFAIILINLSISNDDYI